MPKFKIIVDTVPKPTATQTEAKKFNSKNREVWCNGRKYRLVAKYEYSRSCFNRVGRGFFGVLAAVCTLGLALLLKPVRKLILSSKESIRFACKVKHPKKNLKTPCPGDDDLNNNGLTGGSHRLKILSEGERNSAVLGMYYNFLSGMEDLILMQIKKFLDNKDYETVDLFIEKLKKELPETPILDDIYSMLAKSYLENDDKEKALEAVKNVDSFKYKLTDSIYTTLSSMYLKEGDMEKAIEYMHKIYSENEDKANVLLEIVKTYIEDGKEEEALALRRKTRIDYERNEIKFKIDEMLFFAYFKNYEKKKKTDFLKLTEKIGESMLEDFQRRNNIGYGGNPTFWQCYHRLRSRYGEGEFCLLSKENGWFKDEHQALEYVKKRIDENLSKAFEVYTSQNAVKGGLVT